MMMVKVEEIMEEKGETMILVGMMELTLISQIMIKMEAKMQIWLILVK